jgi:hypothetical protein
MTKGLSLQGYSEGSSGFENCITVACTNISKNYECRKKCGLAEGQYFEASCV